jgi:hypothetical protein
MRFASCLLGVRIGNIPHEKFVPACVNVQILAKQLFYEHLLFHTQGKEMHIIGRGRF